MYAHESMSQIVVQPLDEQHLAGYHTVLSLTYNNGDPWPTDKKIANLPETRSFVALEDGMVSGVCTILEMTATRGNAVLSSAGVAGVAVLPEKRRSGVGSALMSWLVRYMRESGFPVSSLYAFREPFYRKFGYEVAGKRLKITCPSHRWPKLQESLPIRRLGPQDWRELIACHEAFAHRRSGVSLRTEFLWQRVLGENRPLTIYAAGDPVEAYAVVSHQSSFWSTDHLSEVAWSSRAGYETLFSMLEGLAINKQGLSWFEPSDGPFYTRFLDAGVEAKVDRPVMYRINDVEAALSALQPSKDLAGSFSLRIDDQLISENCGPWQVEYQGGHTSVTRLALDVHCDLAMDVRAFSQAYLGQPDLVELFNAELVEIQNPKALEAATSLLPPSAVCCMDFF